MCMVCEIHVFLLSHAQHVVDLWVELEMRGRGPGHMPYMCAFFSVESRVKKDNVACAHIRRIKLSVFF